MISIIIPAHNEENSIGVALDNLLNDLPGNSQIIVVCNGCSDQTAQRTRIYGPLVTVIETETPSKANALNLGDAIATGFPRFYVDADIKMTGADVVKVANVLTSGDALAAAPRMRVNLFNRPWRVKSFYKVWDSLPYMNAGMVGSGVYALNREGRALFDKFPLITSDDGYIRLLFKADQRKTVNEAEFVINAPMDLASLIKIKTRAHFGKIELQYRFPELGKHENLNHRNKLIRMMLNPLWWPSVPIYLFVRFVARNRAVQRWKTGDHKHWERDESSRQILR